MRVSQQMILRVAKVLKEPKTEVYFFPMQIKGRIKLFEKGRKAEYFDSNKVLYNYLVERLKREIENEK
jgi:hypothetical protein